MEIQNNAKALLTKYAVIENLRPMILLHTEMLNNITKAKKSLTIFTITSSIQNRNAKSAD